MESENTKRRKLKLNFFDILIIVIVIALAGGFVVYRAGGSLMGEKNDDSDSVKTTITYTVEITNLDKNTESMIHKGDLLIDRVRRYKLGKVQKAEIYPLERMTNNKIEGKFVNTPDPEKINASLTVKVKGMESSKALVAESGFEIRVGQGVSLIGPGYCGAGYITSVERADN